MDDKFTNTYEPSNTDIQIVIERLECEIQSMKETINILKGISENKAVTQNHVYERYSLEEIYKIKNDMNLSWNELAKLMGCSKSTAIRLVKRYEEQIK